ncbi:hypothetical protein [Gramella sp. Hel_I_59]|uniref:hypothetical protein n=1 Tax=Gramella sp. Hel_I_59 TaxID=1249978 RepID=UPI001151FB09|nr:hypothetical protein [Gramella sp. Hel_I_59]
MKESEYLKGYYDIDIGLTLLFNSIYGEDEYYNFKETTTLPNYKKQFIKLLNTLRKSFKETCLNTDSSHLKEIDILINEEINEIKTAKTVEKIYENLVIFFPKLCFLFIGRIPNNWSKRTKDNRNSWQLNDFRQIEYHQNEKQKFDYLIHLLKLDQIEELKDLKYNGVIEKYRSSKKEKEVFMNWFLRTYPETYIRLFKRSI